MHNGHASVSIEPDGGMLPQGAAGTHSGARPQRMTGARAAERAPNGFNIAARIGGNASTAHPGIAGAGVNTVPNVNTGSGVNTPDRTSQRPVSLGAAASNTMSTTGASVNRAGSKTGAVVNMGVNGTCVDTGAGVNGTCVDTASRLRTDSPIELGDERTPQCSVESRNIFIQAETGGLDMGVGGTEPNLSFDMLRGGWNVNAAHRDGDTALVHAARGGNSTYVEALIYRAGADVNIITRTGTTALMEAIKGAHWACVKILIEAGADVNTPDIEDNKPLIVALEKRTGHGCMCANKLLEAGANVKTTNFYGETAWHLAVEYGLDEVLRTFILAGADVNCTDKTHDAPLVKFVRRNEVKSVMILIELGANVNVRALDGQPVIMEAVKLGNLHTLTMLIDAGADVNATHNYKSTVLMKAAQGGHDSCVELLLESGAKVNERHNNGTTALMNACKTAMYQGAHEEQRLRCVKLLLKAGANVNMRTIHGHSAIIHAAENDSTAIVAELIRAGADVNAATNQGATPLICASVSYSIKLGYFNKPVGTDFMNSGIETVKLLLRAGAHIKRINRDGHNALQSHIVDCDPVCEDLALLLYAAGESVSVPAVERTDHVGHVRSVSVPRYLRPRQWATAGGSQGSAVQESEGAESQEEEEEEEQASINLRFGVIYFFLPWPYFSHSRVTLDENDSNCFLSLSQSYPLCSLAGKM